MASNSTHVTGNTRMSEDAVSLTIRKLRQSLGESQQEFAHRLKMAIRTIARYETARPPRRVGIGALQRIAEAHCLVCRRLSASCGGLGGHPKAANEGQLKTGQ